MKFCACEAFFSHITNILKLENCNAHAIHAYYFFSIPFPWSGAQLAAYYTYMHVFFLFGQDKCTRMDNSNSLVNSIKQKKKLYTTRILYIDMYIFALIWIMNGQLWIYERFICIASGHKWISMKLIERRKKKLYTSHLLVPHNGKWKDFQRSLKLIKAESERQKAIWCEKKKLQPHIQQQDEKKTNEKKIELSFNKYENSIETLFDKQRT